MRRRFPLLLVLAMASLAGCAVRAPSVTTPPATLAVSVADEPAQAAFWTSFGSPLLLALQQQAARDNPDLLIAAQRLRIADDAAQLAEAQQRPALDFHAGPVDSTATALASHRRADEGGFALGFQASYELDLWGRLERLSTAARAEMQASAYDAESLRIATSCLLAKAVFDLGQADQMLALLQQRQLLADRRVQLQGLRLAAGRITAQAFAEAEAQQRAVRRQQLRWQSRRRAGNTQLALLLGRTGGNESPPLVPMQSAFSLPAVPAGLPSELLLRRPDLRAAAARVDASRARDDAEHARRFPQIRLTAELGVASDLLHRAARGAIGLFGFGPELDLPIDDGGALTAQIDAKDRELEIARLEYRKASIAAFADVEQALQLRAAAADRQHDAEQALRRCEAAASALALEQRAGRSSGLDAIEAESLRLDAEQEVLESDRAQLDGALALFEALGGAWMPALTTS